MIKRKLDILKQKSLDLEISYVDILNHAMSKKMFKYIYKRQIKN
jgi:hypothetical protein